MRRAGLAAAFAAYVALVLLVVLAPTSDAPSALALDLAGVARRFGVPEVFLVFHRVEFALNALMVAPVAVLGSLLWPAWTWRDWLATGFVASAAVELAQGLWLPERAATFADVVANTLGAGLGAALVALARFSARARG